MIRAARGRDAGPGLTATAVMFALTAVTGYGTPATHRAVVHPRTVVLLPYLTPPKPAAVRPDGRTVYAAVNGDVGPDAPGRHVVVPISTATNTPGTPITVGHGPSALAISPDGRTLYVADGDDSAVTPVTISTERPGPDIRVGWIFGNANPSALAVTPNGRTLYVADSNSVAVIPLSGA